MDDHHATVGTGERFSEYASVKGKGSGKPARTVNLRIVYEAIQQGRYRKQIEALRATLANDGPDAYKVAKVNLPAWTFAARFDGRRRKGEGMQPSGLACFDFDDLKKHGLEPEDLIARCTTNQHVALAFASPSNDGAKVVVKLAPPPQLVEVRTRKKDGTERLRTEHLDSDYQAAYEQVGKRLASDLGVEPALDEQTKDMPRACFAAWDTQCHYNPDAKPIAWDRTDIDSLKELEERFGGVDTGGGYIPGDVKSPDEYPFELRYNGDDEQAEVRFTYDVEFHEILTADWLHISNLCDDENIKFTSETELHWRIKKGARRNLVHPERDRLVALADRADELREAVNGYVAVKDVLSHLFEVDDVMPPELTQYASSLLIGGWIQRRIAPGSKLDNMPILTGTEGIGKSTLLKLITRDRVYEYTSPIRELTAKSLIENTPGMMIIELAEFKPPPNELNRLKGVLSQQTDLDRTAHARSRTRKPRTFAFVGTTNEDAVIPPDDSNRRFVIVKLLKARLSESDTDYFVQDHLEAWEAECARFVLDGGTYAMPQRLTAINAQNANTHFVNVDDWWVKGIAMSEVCKRAAAAGPDFILSKVEIWQAVLDAHQAEPQHHPYRQVHFALGKALDYMGWTKIGRRRNGDGENIQHYSPPARG